MQPITAIILAGERPGGDPLAQRLGIQAKALIPIAGLPMVRHVTDAIGSIAGVDRIEVLTQHPEMIASLLADSRMHVAQSEPTIAATMKRILHEGGRRLLVTTADHPLLSPEMLHDFLHEAEGADLAFGVVERRTLLARFPESRRTWLKFRGGAYSGANLFWICGEQVLPLLELWADVEQKRKRGHALVAAFGPLVLIGALFRLLTLRQALEHVGRRHGVVARAVILPQAEACIDVDKEDDLALVEQIVRDRASG